MPSPMMKATLAATALSGASNILAQILESYRDGFPFSFDPALFLRFVTVTFLTAPPNYMWQQLLERTFPAYHQHEASKRKEKDDEDRRNLEKESAMERGVAGGGDNTVPTGAGAATRKQKLNIKNTLAKWFIDCITLGAIFNTVAFFVLMGVLKGQSGAVILSNVRTETIPVIVAGYKIWPFASIISFSCVPVERRLVFLNFVGLLWGVYMSLVASRV
ncbi:hypothetical protein F5Y17DRAFT_441514 [Xylariaceae sp. FL0594]|nr:hypothetical protein F5Y17DRAFT_441514 [Xylariaceae sp. FL0594]